MRIHVIAVGERMPAWVKAGFEEYAGRLPENFRLQLREVAAGRRGKSADIERLRREEGERLFAAVPKRCRAIVLDRGGRALSTEELARELSAHAASGDNLALLIGGPDGLPASYLKRASSQWSLSRLTLAHPLARVVVAEQIYRAWSILNNLPYHR